MNHNSSMETLANYQPKTLTSKHQILLKSTSTVSQSAKHLHDILISTPQSDIETALTSSGIPPTHEIIHEVLKLSYSNPTSAVKFFRWAGRVHKPTPYAWNLMVDILGKNSLFDPMWDAIRSMRQEELLSVTTFASVFGSYCVVGRFKEAVMSFDVMNKYGIAQDVVAVNSLLSSLCPGENGGLSEGMEFFERVKDRICLNSDTFAILLEGCEKERNVEIAKRCFEEMVKSVGWNKEYELAYEAFLTTLVRGGYVEDVVVYLSVMKEKGCLPGLKFFSNAIHVLVKGNDSSNVVPIWDVMVSGGLLPDLAMYNDVIGLLCDNDDVDGAFKLLDEMAFNGAFPDLLTYNLIFRCLIKNKKVRQVGKFFYEMIKNEITPTHLDCCAAITMLIDGDDPEMAIEIWNYMVENHVLPLDESANALLTGLCNLGRVLEVGRLVEDMLDRRIIIYESTMTRFKFASCKEGGSARKKYDILLQRWKSC